MIRISHKFDKKRYKMLVRLYHKLKKYNYIYKLNAKFLRNGVLVISSKSFYLNIFISIKYYSALKKGVKNFDNLVKQAVLSKRYMTRQGEYYGKEKPLN